MRAGRGPWIAAAFVLSLCHALAGRTSDAAGHYRLVKQIGTPVRRAGYVRYKRQFQIDGSLGHSVVVAND